MNGKDGITQLNAFELIFSTSVKKSSPITL